MRKREILGGNSDLEALDWLKVEWGFFPKNQIWTFKSEDAKHTYTYFAAEVQGTRFVLGVEVGPRGGLSEIAFVWKVEDEKTKKQPEVNQLVLADVTNKGDGYFVSLAMMRLQIKQGQDATEVCRYSVESAAHKMLGDEHMLRNVQRNSQSIHVGYCPYSGRSRRLRK